jgi:hypothetical protein
MVSFILNKTGYFHDIHTEDHVFLKEIEHDWMVGAVMDGCSSGIETYFASTLYGKILQKACRMLPHLNKINPDFSLNEMNAEFIGSFMLNQIFDDLRKTHKLLSTDLVEMLSTLLLLIYNKKNRSAWINISGDGLIVQNGKILEIDQNNVPDYMAYHLDVPFNQWKDQFTNTYTYENVHDVSLSTDGISKFISHSEKRPRSIDPIHYLLIDKSLSTEENMLEEKFKILEKEYGLVPYDDLGMIRIMNA